MVSYPCPADGNINTSLVHINAGEMGDMSAMFSEDNGTEGCDLNCWCTCRIGADPMP